jgi:hypothetical protein
MSGVLRSGACGIDVERLADLERPAAHVGWDDATLEVRDAAAVFEEVMGDRRRREAAEAAENSSGPPRGLA